MKFDRSKFKKQEISELSETIKKAQSTMGSQNKEFVQYVSLVEGKNIFRVLPNVKSSLIFAPLKVSKLDCLVPTYDKDGNKTGEEVKSKNVFCADVHGEKLLKGKDPINTYCSYVYNIAEEEYQDRDEKSKFLAPLTGYRNRKGEYVWGITPTLNYVCYVYLQDKNRIAKLQLRPAWLKRIKEISLEQSEEDTVCLDVFSGVDDGYPLVITQGMDEKRKKTYSVSAGLPGKKQSWDDFFEENAIPDEILEELSELPTLDDLFVDSYSKKDFELAIDGLKRFDEENGYGVFENDDFLNELEEMAKNIPDEDENPKPVKEEKELVEKKSKTTKKTLSKKRNDEEEIDEDEKPEEKKYPSLIKLKTFLKNYIETEYEGEEELPDLDIVTLKEWYDLAKAGKMLPFDDYKDDPDGLPFKDDDDEGDEDENNPIDEDETDDIEESKQKIRSIRERLSRK